MNALRFILNVLWLVLGGIWGALAWYVVGILAAITIIGLPWARSCFMIGTYTLWPFGRDIIARDVLYGREDIGTGVLGIVGAAVWLIGFLFEAVADARGEPGHRDHDAVSH